MSKDKLNGIDRLFDLDHDGRLNDFERVSRFEFMDSLINGKGEEPDFNEGLDDDLGLDDGLGLDDDLGLHDGLGLDDGLRQNDGLDPDGSDDIFDDGFNDGFDDGFDF